MLLVVFTLIVAAGIAIALATDRKALLIAQMGTWATGAYAVVLAIGEFRNLM